MFEKVGINHPDKVADRIAGAILDVAYAKQKNPKCAVEVLIGHGNCHIINETSCHLEKEEVQNIVNRIVGYKTKVDYLEVEQDAHLSKNQKTLRCGDNGVFSGRPVSKEQGKLTGFVELSDKYHQEDSKFILNEKDKKLICCQSNVKTKQYEIFAKQYFKNYDVVVNPLGDWTGGINVDSGATNRKLGSDMGDAITGGGLHGKDLSKADVSVNIYAHLKAQETGKKVECYCAIGDKFVNVVVGKNSMAVSYEGIVEIARKYIKSLGGFEKFAEWGLIR